MKKQLLIYLFIALAGFSVQLNAQSIWDGTADISWYDATQSSFTITTAEELAGLASIVNAGTDDFQGNVITLGADIWLNSEGSTTNNWIPIGGSATSTGEGASLGNSFKGTFDGAGHTIYNMYCNKSSYFHAGLFGKIAAATIYQVAMINPTVISQGMMGALVGFAYSGGVVNIYDCMVINATITGTGGNNIGAILGANYSNTSGTNITSCGVTGTISGNYCGGLGGNSSYVVYNNCYFAGSITASPSGGICSYSGTVTDSYSNFFGSNTVGNGTTKTTAEMQNATFLADLDSTYRMDCGLNNGFPIKTWQSCGANISGDLELCVGESTTLTSTGFESYLWSTGSTSSSITVSPTTTTSYYITVTNDLNETIYDTATVVVYPQAVITATAIASYDGIIHGTVTPSESYVGCGSSSTVTLTITPDVNWHISRIMVNGVEVRGEDPTDGPVVTYTIDPLGTLCDVKVYFYDKYDFNVLLLDVNGNTITNGYIVTPYGTNGIYSVSAGTNVTYHFNNTLRYHLTDVTIDGVSQGIINTYTFSDVQESHSIQATYLDSCGIFSLPVVENFDAYEAYITPDCWTCSNTASSYTNYPYITPTSYSTPNGFLFYSSPNTYSLGVTPLIDSTDIDITALRVSFRYRCTDLSGSFEVGVMSDPNDINTFVTISSMGGSVSTQWEDKVVYFANYTGNGHYIAFKWSNSSYYSASIDDIVIELAPTCSEVSNLTVSNINGSNATLNWTPNVVGGNSGYTIQYCVEGTDNWIYEVADTNHYILLGLTEQTNYTVQVIADCAENGFSQPAEISFVTPCYNPIDLTIGTGTSSAHGSYLPINSFYCHSYSQQIYLASELNNQPVDLAGIAFQYFYSSPDTRNIDIYLAHTDSAGFDTQGWLPATNFVKVFSGNVTFNNANSWFTIPFDTVFSFNGTQNLLVSVDDNTGSYANSGDKFYTHSTTGNKAQYIYSDGTNYNPYTPTFSYTASNNRPNIQFIYCGASTCIRPSNVTISNITAYTADIAWIAGGQETSWDIEYKLFTDSIWNSDGTISTNFHTLSGLQPESEYQIRVRSNCGNNDVSPWTSLLTFITPPSCFIPTEIVFSNIDLSSVDISWEGPSNASGWIIEYGPHGFTEGTGTEVNTSTNSASLTGLTGNTQYDVYLYADCAGDGYSQHVANTFSTLPCLSSEYCLYTFELHDSFGDGWNGNNITIYVNDSINQVVTLGSGSNGTINVGFCTNDSVDFVFNTGSYTSEVSFTINFPFGQGVAYTCSSGSSMPTGTPFLSLLIDCTPPSCPRPENVVVSNITTTSVDLSWTDLNANPTSWNIEYGPNGFAQGTGTTVVATTNPFTLTGINPSSSYTVYVQGNCGEGNVSFWSLPQNFITECDNISTLPYVEYFDTYGSTGTAVMVPCWYRYNAGAGQPHVSSYTNTSAPYCLNLYATSASYSFVRMNAFDASIPVNTLMLSFNLRLRQTGVFEVGVMTDTLNSSFVPVDTLYMTNNDTWEAFEVPLNNYTGSGQYIAFRWSGVGSYVAVDAYLDNLIINTIPTCISPIGLISNHNTNTTVDLEWTERGTATSWNIIYGPTGFIPTTGGTTISAPTNPFTVTGLSSDTIYDFYVQADCGSGDFSNIRGPISVTPGAVNMPSSGIDTLYMCNAHLYDDGGISANYSLSANGTAIIYPDAPGNVLQIQGTYIGEGCCDYLSIYDGVGTSAQLLTQVVGQGNGITVNVGPYMSTTGPLTVQFTSDGSISYNGFDLLVTCISASCLPPSGVTGISDLNSVDLSWTENGTATAWNIIYGPAGFDPETAGTTIAVTTNPYTVTGLNAATLYDFYVQADCGSTDGLSNLSSVAHIGTTICASTDQCTYTINMFDEYGDGWNNAYFILKQNGIEIGSFGNTSFNSSLTETVSLCDGMTTTITWVPGPYDEECGFYITDVSGDTVSVFNYFSISGVSGIIDSFMVNCSGGAVTCEAPTNVMSSNVGMTDATIVWTAGGTESEWIVEYKVASASTYTVVNNITSVSYQMTGLTANTTYNVRVKAVCDDNSTSDYSSVYTFTTSDCPAPSNLTSVNITSNSAILSWTAGGDETSWVLEYKRSTDADYTSINTTTNPHEIINLLINTTYNVRVKAVCSANNHSSYSSVYTFTTASDGTTYTITATAGMGGNITPSGSVTVAHGTNQTFTITPDPSFAVSAVFVDGENLGNITTYTFVNVVADHAIEAQFGTGIEQYNSNENIILYPNPTQNFIEIRVQNNELTINQAAIYDVYGKLIKIEQISNNQATIHVHDFASGIYFIRIETNNGLVTKKFIKE